MEPSAFVGNGASVNDGRRKVSLRQPGVLAALGLARCGGWCGCCDRSLLLLCST